jgi:hypothetical protein
MNIIVTIWQIEVNQEKNDIQAFSPRKSEISKKRNLNLQFFFEFSFFCIFVLNNYCSMPFAAIG